MTSYKMPCIITRGNNVYGPHQFPEKLIPKFTLLASRGAPLPVHGDGGATRSYLFVEDVAEAFETVLLKGKIGETYNIGTQKERTVLDVATVRKRYSFFLHLIWFRTKKTVFSPPSSRKKKTQPERNKPLKLEPPEQNRTSPPSSTSPPTGSSTSATAPSTTSATSSATRSWPGWDGPSAPSGRTGCAAPSTGTSSTASGPTGSTGTWRTR
jgi:hypothetical protein